MSGLAAIRLVVGDLARPFAIISTAGAVTWAIIDPGTGADKLTAAGLILLGLYGAKTIEKTNEAKQTASVEVSKNVAAAAQAQAPGGPVPQGGRVELAPGERLQVRAEEVPAPEDLPPWERPR